MKQNKGWIKIPREIMNHWLWLDPRKLQMWMAMVFLAQFEPKKTVMVDNVEVTLYRGDFFMSLRKLSQRLGCSKNTLLTFLRVLESQGMISRITMHKITVISILNFEMYCGSDDVPREGAAEGAATPSGDTEKEARRIRYVGHNDRRGKGNGKREEKGSKNDSKTHKKEVEKSPVSGQSLNPSKEIRNNILPHTTHTYAREDVEEKKIGDASQSENRKTATRPENSEDREKRFFEEFMTQQQAWESMALSLQTDVKILKELAGRWFESLRALEQTHTDLKSFKQHFMNWARIELRNSRAAGPKGYTHQTTTKPNSYGTDSSNSIRTAGEDRFRCRRSTDPGDPKTTDYNAPL